MGFMQKGLKPRSIPANAQEHHQYIAKTHSNSNTLKTKSPKPMRIQRAFMQKGLNPTTTTANPQEHHQHIVKTHSDSNTLIIISLKPMQIQRALCKTP